MSSKNPLVVALVPMRHESERVPGKNYRRLTGNLFFPPILFSLFPVLSLFAANLGEVLPGEYWRSLIVSLIGALALWFVLNLILKDIAKASILTIIAIIAFFFYGHLYNQVKGLGFDGVVIGRHRFLLPVWGFSLLFIGWWMVYRLPKLEQVLRFLNVVSFAMVLLPLYSIISFYAFSSVDYRLHQAVKLIEGLPQIIQGESPDIYYIILDGYTGADVLLDIYEFDNSPFLGFLEQNGFYIAGESHSNYPQTYLSLSASLNMQYVNYLADVLGQDSTDRRPLYELVQNNLLREFLKSNNYQVVSFQTGFGATEWEDAEYFLVAENRPVSPRSSAIRLFGFDYDFALNNFENLLLETTLLRPFLGSSFLSRTSVGQALIDPAYQFQRDRVISTLSHVSDFAPLDGNYFVFAHIVSPHPPFVFGPNGERVQPDKEYSNGDGIGDGTVEYYISGYRDQIQYVNKLVSSAVNTILEKSVVPPIIIIQGDHGPAAYLDWEEPEDTNLDERFSVLNAYYFPDGDYSQLYPTITPVNSFRIVLNQYFGGSYELLPDESFFSGWHSPYDFLNITNQLSTN